MTAQKDALVEAVDALYPLFSRHRIGDLVEGCPCCVDPREGRALATTPMKELPDELVRRYAGKSMTTWGTEEDFLHFVPVIWERLVLGRLDAAPQPLHAKLAPRLSPRERVAIQRVIGCWLDHAIASGGPTIDALECAALLGMPLGPLIARLDEATCAPTPEAASCLAELGRALRRADRLHWEPRTDGGAELARWIGANVPARLTAALVAHPEHPEAPEWQAQLWRLESLSP